MPILTSTPATPPVWVQEAYYPNIDQAAIMGTEAFNSDQWIFRPWLGEPPRDSQVYAEAGPAEGGTGVLKRYEGFGGLPYALRYSTTGVPASNTVRVPFLYAGYNPGSAAGALIGREDLRVVWWREAIAYTGGFGDGGCGHVWSWDNPNLIACTWAENGAAVQQHGIFGDGSGGLEYRSYSAAPALLEAVPIPGVALGSWIMADHQFIAWAPGRAASYELRVNGTLIVQRDYGSAELPFPGATVRLQWCPRMTSAGGVKYFGYFLVRAGRFTMDGLELRS